MTDVEKNTKEEIDQWRADCARCYARPSLRDGSLVIAFTAMAILAVLAIAWLVSQRHPVASLAEFQRVLAHNGFRYDASRNSSGHTSSFRWPVQLPRVEVSLDTASTTHAAMDEAIAGFALSMYDRLAGCRHHIQWFFPAPQTVSLYTTLHCFRR